MKFYFFHKTKKETNVLQKNIGVLDRDWMDCLGENVIYFGPWTLEKSISGILLSEVKAAMGITVLPMGNAMVTGEMLIHTGSDLLLDTRDGKAIHFSHFSAWTMPGCLSVYSEI